MNAKAIFEQMNSIESTLTGLEAQIVALHNTYEQVLGEDCEAARNDAKRISQMRSSLAEARDDLHEQLAELRSRIGAYAPDTAEGVAASKSRRDQVIGNLYAALTAMGINPSETNDASDARRHYDA